MSEAETMRGLVRLVADGLCRRAAEPEIVARLVIAGIPESRAPELMATVRQSIQAGVTAEVTDGLSAPNGPPDDPLLAEAFRYGQASLRREARRARLERLAPFVVVATLIAALAAWWFWR